MRVRVIDRAARALAALVGVITVAFLLGPVVLVLYMSTSSGTFLEFPVSTYGWTQYQTVADNSEWLDSVITSVKIALPVAIGSTLIGGAAALAIHRSRVRGRGALRALTLLPLLIPGAALAVSLYGLFARFGLIGTYPGMVVAHLLLALPFVMILMNSALQDLPLTPELVAMSLGASRARAWWDVLLPPLRPSIAASLFVGFFVSFDEAMLITFLGGGMVNTLPKVMFDSVLFGIKPEVTAVAALLIFFTCVMTLAMEISQRRSVVKK